MRESGVTIIGAGPAGMTAALFLVKNKIPVTLIEKGSFPRDKVCGDCLGGFAISVLRQIDEGLFERFSRFEKKMTGSGVHFYGPNQQKISSEALNTVGDKMKEVAICKRIDFDNFLMDEIKNHNQIRLIENSNIANLKNIEGTVKLYNKSGELVSRSQLIIMATGSNQSLIYKITQKRTAKKRMAAGIRAYFEGIEGFDPPGFIELHFLKELAPGYLWIFPLPNNQANVGIGLRSDIVSRKRINMEQLFHQCIKKNPYLKERFFQANQLTECKGFPLALGGTSQTISGDRYLLAGDAANLIEPLFGEGIGHAMYSGKFAAEQAIECIKANNYSARFNKQYDHVVYQKLGSTLRFSKLMHQIAFYPKMMNFIFKRVGKNEELKSMLTQLINGNIPKNPRNGLKFIRKLLIDY